MILKNNKKVFFEDSVLEMLEVRVKTWIYIIMHELLQAQLCSPFLYKILILIESIQLLWYSIHPRLTFLWNTSFGDYFRELIEYFQFDELLETSGSGFFVAVLYIVFSVEIIMVLALVFISWKITRKKKTVSTFLTYSLKLFSLFAILLNTIATIPFFNIFFATFICSSGDPIHTGMQCYQGIYFLHLVVAIIGIIIMIFFTAISTMLYAELNPNPAIPFASPQNRLGAFKLLIKMVLPLYIVIDYNANFTYQYIAILGVYWLLFLAIRYKAAPFYDKSVYTFLIVCESFIFWTTVCSNIHAFMAVNVIQNLGLFFLFLLAPFVAYTYKKILDEKTWGILKLDVRSCKRDTDVEAYAHLILDLIEKKDRPESRIKLEGLLKYHVRHCNKKDDECICYIIAKDNMKDEENPEKLRNWYSFVKIILVDGLEKFQKSAKLHFLYAYVQHSKLKNKYKALFELMTTEESKPNIQEEFSVYRYKNLIEEEMIENDIRNSESKGIDVNVIVHFQNKFVFFQSSLEKSVGLHLDFWRELLEESPDIQKLQGLGSKITNNVEITAEQFKKLNEMNPNHIKCLLIYGNFLKDIVNDEIEGQRILEKAEYVDKSSNVNKQFIDNDRLKYGENSNTCIVTCSGNVSSMGIVINSNNEITRILEFTKSEIIGRNINTIMPKIIGDMHDGLMKRYFETSEAKVVGTERLVFPMNKSGYVVPCTLMIKVLPNLDEGIKIVGFLKDVESGSSYLNADFDSDEKVHYILYGGENSVVQGITYSCYQSFGIPAELIYGNNTSSNELTIDAIFPDLNTQNIEELKSPSGLILHLDTTTLQNNYLIRENSKGSNEYNPDDLSLDGVEKPSKYKKSKIRAIMISDEEFQDNNLKVLKFVEVNDNEEMKKSRSAAATGENHEIKKEDGGQQAGEGVEEHDGNKSIGDSEHDSSVSAGSVNDDLRQLKDFKALISEKTVPKSIKILARSVLFLGAMLITLISVDLSLNFTKTSEMTNGVNSIYEAYQRHDVMADINFNSRELELLAMNMTNLTLMGITNKTDELSTKASLSSEINNLQTIQFDVIKSDIEMQSLATTTRELNYTTEYLLQNNQTQNQSNMYNDALFQYITSASSIANSTLGSFTSTSDVESTGKNFFFVRVNGLDPLRNGSETIASNFYNFYYNRTSFFDSSFRIIMIVAIVFLIISQFVLVPIVFSVHRTNNKVLSLFGYIPTNEITELAQKCEKYINNWLEERTEKHDFGFEKNQEDAELMNSMVKSEHPPLYTEVNADDPAGQENLEVSMINGVSVNNKIQQYIKDNPVQVNTNNLSAMNGMNLQVPQQKFNGMTASNNTNLLKLDVSMNKSTNDKIGKDGKKPEKNQVNPNEIDKKEILKEEQDQENLNERAQKLLNAKDNNRRNVIMQFAFITFIFISLFIGDYVVQIVYLQNVTQCLRHLQLISERAPNLKYEHVFALEEMSLGEPYLLNEGEDMNLYYVDQVYNVEGQITRSLQNSFPTSFSNYVSTSINFNLQDTCNWYYNVTLGNSVNLTACKAIQNGILSKGLQTSVVAVIEQDRSVLSSFFQNQNTDPNSPYDEINSVIYYTSTQMLSYMIPAIEYLLSLYVSNFNDFFNYYLTINKVVFVLGLFLIILTYLLVWSPYLTNLSSKIWRTKGMLNMIPMDIISKNENLKNMFISGDLLQAVK